jgi:electron transport complex protein RnfC
MITGIKIPTRKKMSIKEKIGVYNKMKYVYIPLISGNDTNITVSVKKGDYVYKGTIIGKRKGNFRIPIHSSVSGTVIDYEEKYTSNGKKVRCVVIENDFLDAIEKEYENNEITKYTKKEFLKTIQDCGIVGLGGSGFPTYIKYNIDKKINTLIINAVECEPYITADFVLFREKCEEILETIDAIREINNIDEAIIAIKNTNTELKEMIDNYIGTYLKLKVVEVPNIYPMGWEKSLVKYIKKTDYSRLPMEKGIIVNNVSTVYAIYEALKYKKPLTERIVTFTGENLKRPQNVMVKIGTSAREVIKKVGGLNNKEVTYVAGGPMMGIEVPTDDIIINSNDNCILVLNNIKEIKAQACIRCGKCVENCPAKLSPVLIGETLKNTKKLKKLEPDRCIECGLCSYICPAKLNVREKVRLAKEKLRKEC